MILFDPLSDPLLTEVACSDVIRQARVTRVSSKGMKKLARVSLKRSESGTHSVFRKFGRSLDVKISRTDLVSKPNFPYVKSSDWLKHVVETDNLQQLVGVKNVADMRTILSTFWGRYESLFPEHVVFSRRDPGFSREFCIPVLYHGDERRGLKKRQLMVLSTHGVLGAGSTYSNAMQNDIDDPVLGPLRLNMVGNTFLNHFLQCVLPITLYNETPEDFYSMLDLQAQEFAQLFQHGLKVCGHRFFICCIGVKGDAPFLSKSGMFERHFLRRPTRPTGRVPCAGVCHLCLAGKESAPNQCDWPFEEFGAINPLWRETMGVESPYSTPSPLLQIPYETTGTNEGLWKFDLFHNFHSGMGKYFASSAVCIVLEMIDNTIDGAFATITEDFKTFCVHQKECPYHKKLSASLFGVHVGFGVCPEAAWSKGSFTYLVLKWLGDWCQRNVIGKTQDDLYLMTVTGFCFRTF